MITSVDKYISFFVVPFFVFFSGFSVFAQTPELNLAKAYYQQAEYEKAVSIFKKHVKDNRYDKYLHRQYLSALYRLDKKKAISKYLNWKCKDYPKDMFYNIDYIKYLIDYGDSTKADLHLRTYLNAIKQNPQALKSAANYFINLKMFAQAERTYLVSEDENIPTFYYQMASLYLAWGKVGKMIEQYLALLLIDERQLPFVQNMLQNNTGEEDAAVLEKILIAKTQRFPQKIVLNEMMLWFYLQRKKFKSAFIQARALDRKKKLSGRKIMSIGNMALDNGAHKDAVQIYDYVVRKYADNKKIYNEARRLLAAAKIELLKKKYPIDKAALAAVVADYEGIIAESGLNFQTAQSAHDMALLQAFYLDNKDTAVIILEKVLAISGLNPVFAAQLKLDLADVYLLKGEPWEASLLYTQVEKAQKERPLGHIAKLKSAKLHYYTGDFRLAKSHLDVLKRATSREIANDAMHLSLLIEDNLALDTTETAMKAFAKADLLVFQQKYTDALATYDGILRDYPQHSLSDEILWEKAKIMLAIKNFQEAVRSLEKILSDFQNDILADDANFLLGKIYEENLNDKNKAMEYYKNQLIHYKGSIHTAEARKRFRLLRGDDV